MAYRVPTSRRGKKKEEGINLIPILDAVFIFIFFLLMSTQFVKIFEIGSDVPLISNQQPPKKLDKEFNVSLDINTSNLIVITQNPDSRVRIPNSDGTYDYETLREYLLKLKKTHIKSEQIILNPKNGNIDYETIVKIMDAVRTIKNTDEALFKKDKDGIDVQVKKLFHKIIFGNTMS